MSKGGSTGSATAYNRPNPGQVGSAFNRWNQSQQQPRPWQNTGFMDGVPGGGYMGNRNLGGPPGTLNDIMNSPFYSPRQGGGLFGPGGSRMMQNQPPSFPPQGGGYGRWGQPNPNQSPQGNGWGQQNPSMDYMRPQQQPVLRPAPQMSIQPMPTQRQPFQPPPQRMSIQPFPNQWKNNSMFY